MRTTLTIEDDVAVQLDRLQRERKQSFLTLYSTDGDFARFPGLKWVNPLAR